MSEFDVLKASHKFLRSTDDHKTWEDQVAQKYESSLFREFAVCDLKHYKSGQFALRWRTEDEVVSGAGQDTCGNTRCDHHLPGSGSRKRPSLQTLELPFHYVEHGENHSALVKVVLCERCVHKIMWKRNRDKEERQRLEYHPTSNTSLQLITRSEESTSDATRSIHRRRSVSPRSRNRDSKQRDRSRSPRRRRHLHDDSVKQRSGGPRVHFKAETSFS